MTGRDDSPTTRTAATPAPGARLYFEQVRVGQRFTTGAYTMTESEIRAFAAQFDPQPFHLDAAAARGMLFGGLVASGWHTAAVTMRLLVEAGAVMAEGTIGVGAELSWLAPVRPGERLHVESEVIAVAPSRSRRERGYVTTRNETINERGVVVQRVVARMLVPRGPPSAGGP